MLILFDIDGTILLTRGAGIEAMGDAGRELFGEHFTTEGVEFSGRLDTLIWQDLARRNRVSNHEVHHDTFRAAYGRHLTRRLKDGGTARLLPGVQELVTQLARIDHVTLGLLTGNYPETGCLKIEAAGLDPDLFAIAAWGCEGSCRRDLPLVAMRRHEDATGRAAAGEQVVIIGDTPHDIDCAKHHGCRALGVATGLFSVQSLREAGADLAVERLLPTDEIVRWLLQDAPAVVE
jgi:phosphoglycolate phosphatase